MFSKRTGLKGFFIGLGLGLMAGSLVFGIWFELFMKKYLEDIQSFADETVHQDFPMEIAFVQMAEKGEVDRIISGYCKIIRGRLNHLNPDTIADEGIRNKVIENIEEARLVVDRLESDQKC